MLNRRSTDLQPSKPLVGIQPETLSTYISHMSAIFYTLKNMLDLVSEGASTLFRFSDEQTTLLQELFATNTSIDLAPLVLRTMKALLGQKLYGDPFESPLLSALAILSVQRKEGGQWYEPRGYPGYMSALAGFSPLCAYQQIALSLPSLEPCPSLKACR
ncbi:hypothetical protein CEP54_004502 [Fusarium duplospermum]|uniref:Uncharacterized protein n=1 Tax=Fusarium duplospermum TaxID=1325734 RepID=A0A428QI19_9HYPO|nr:hypothetical protein CEP54_004502 [Fusarium duplospermum]